MKITVMDVMNSKSDVRGYLSVHPENGRIYVNSKAENVVLIDKTEEWDELKAENDRLREENIGFKRDVENYEKAIESYKQACRNWEAIMSIHNQENLQLRKALEFYAEATQYMYKSRSLKGHPTIINDEGATARQALKGE